MVAIGGFSRIWGVLFGVAFVTLVSEALKPLGDYDVVVFGLLLVVAVGYFPQGMLQTPGAAGRPPLRYLREPAPRCHRDTSSRSKPPPSGLWGPPGSTQFPFP